jgi:hypothetical protein
VAARNTAQSSRSKVRNLLLESSRLGSFIDADPTLGSVSCWYPSGLHTSASARSARKQRGDFATPPDLVELVIERTLGPIVPGQRVAVLDPACGDGRFLVAAARRVHAAGGVAELHGVDVHDDAAAAARRRLAAAGLRAHIETADALGHDWPGARYDAVVGNPPYLSQLAAATTRGGSSRLGGGPYADVAAEFLALAVRLARPDGGRVGLVLPQSILASRDAGPVRAAVDRDAALRWSWWSPARHFDAQVTVCVLVFERGAIGGGRPWSSVVTEALGVPQLPALATAGTLGDRARISANFRDQFYGLVGAVDDGGEGPPLVTSGLIDPGRCAWGERPVRFAGQRFERPRVTLAALAPAMRRWADDLLVPKVLVANQTPTVEAVADRRGEWLPGVPVLTARPIDVSLVRPIAAVLLSPVTSCWAWHRAAGTGLSARTLRLGPQWLGELPWPAGDLAEATDAYDRGDVLGCAAAVTRAYGADAGADDPLTEWWTSRLPGRAASAR